MKRTLYSKINKTYRKIRKTVGGYISKSRKNLQKLISDSLVQKKIRKTQTRKNQNIMKSILPTIINT